MRAVRKERGAGGRADAGRAAPVFESASRARLRARRVRVVSCSGCAGSICPGCVGSRRRGAVLDVWSSPSMVRALASVVAVISVRTGRMCETTLSGALHLLTRRPPDVAIRPQKPSEM